LSQSDDSMQAEFRARAQGIADYLHDDARLHGCRSSVSRYPKHRTYHAEHILPAQVLQIVAISLLYFGKIDFWAFKAW
jgi:hypothetical protein